MAKSRQLSQREIKQVKDAQAGGPIVVLYNPRAQMVTVRRKPPQGTDFFTHEQAINIRGQKTARIPREHLDWDQINNLQKRGHIRVVATADVAQAPAQDQEPQA
jgi:hypothetical protein